MDVNSYLAILANEIHSVVIATIDENGLPTTRIIDIMLHDKQGVYFITAKGKAFYKQITKKTKKKLFIVERDNRRNRFDVQKIDHLNGISKKYRHQKVSRNFFE